MSIFTRMFDRYSTPLSLFGTGQDNRLSVFRPRTDSGRSVTRENSLQLVAVYACQSLIADGISMLPVDHLTKAKGIRKKLEGRRSPAWIQQPNPHQTTYEFWHRVVTSLLSDGNAFIATDRDASGDVIALYCLHPQDVDIVDGPVGAKEFRIGGESRLFDTSQILHIPAFAVPGKARGLSPLDVAREAIGLGLTAQEFGTRFFEQGAAMTGVIEHPGSPRPNEAMLLRDMFKKTHSGVKKSHSVGVLTGGASFKPITIAPEQAQFLETRRFQKSEIALLYRIPAYLVDSTVTSSWGSGVEEQNKFFIDQTLMPWIVRIEQAISTFLLPRGESIRFNADARLRAKTKDRYEAYAVAINNGFMSRDEVRALEDLPPLPAGQGATFVQPLNMAQIGKKEAA